MNSIKLNAVAMTPTKATIGIGSTAWKKWKQIQINNELEIKPCGLGSRIRDVEAFWYKTEIKIICFVQLCLIALIVCDCMVYPD